MIVLLCIIWYEHIEWYSETGPWSVMRLTENQDKIHTHNILHRQNIHILTETIQ